MSSPTPTTPPTETGFDPLVFWYHHQAKVLMLAALFLVAMAAYGGLRVGQLAQALRVRRSALVRNNRGRFSQGHRGLLRNAGGWKRRHSARESIEKRGQIRRIHLHVARIHRQISQARIDQRRLDEHRRQPGSAGGGKPTRRSPLTRRSPRPTPLLTVPLSPSWRKLASSRRKGKTDEARRIYEQVMTQYQDNIVAQQAAIENRQIKK